MRRWLREFRFPWRSELDVRRDVDDELDFHLASRAEELERDGLAPEEARRKAVLEFGDLEAARRSLASSGWRSERLARSAAALEALHRDASDALRSLRRNPKLTLVAAFVLALGIGSSTAVFAMLDTLLLRALPLHEPERLLAIGEQPPPDAQWTMQTVRLAVLKQWQADAQTFEGLDGFTSPQLTWHGPDGPERIAGGAVVDDLFGVLGATMAVGRPFTGAEHADSPAVLSDAFWRQRFGARRDVIGETLNLDGTLHTIAGVLPPEAATVLGTDPRVWIALDRATAADEAVHVRVLGRLRAGVEPNSAAAELAAIQRTVEEERGFATPARGVTIRSVRQNRAELFGATLFALFGGALLLVVIASANVGTLMLTRLVERRHELAVRASLGASRWRVARQILAEHIVLWAIGGAAGLVLGALALRVASRAEPLARAATGVAIDARVVLFAGGITLLASALFGLLPALGSARQSPMLALREDGAAASPARSGRRWRQSLVVAQVGLSTVLASGACLLALSLFNLTTQPLGFRPDELLTFRVQLPQRGYPDQATRVQFQRGLLAELRELPGVEIAATTSAPPLGTIVVGPIGIDGEQAREERLWAAMQAVDRDYFATAGTAVSAGRGFGAADDGNGERVAIVNASFARKYFADGDALGRRVAPSAPGDGAAQWLRIVGVVEDVKHAGLDFEYFPEIFIPYEQLGDGPAGAALGAELHALLRVPDAFAPSVSALRRIVARLDPGLPVMELRTGRQLVAASAERAEARAAVMTGIALLAVLLSGLGLYAVLSQSVAQRHKELGIRMALGATSASLVHGVCRQGIALCAFGIGAGVLAALALARYVQSLLYGVSAFEPAVLGGVAAFMFLVAVLAAAIPSFRTTKLSPTLAIRSFHR